MTMEMDLVEQAEISRRIVDPARPISVALRGFESTHKGVTVLRETMVQYVRHWAGFSIADDDDPSQGEILVVNEDSEVIEALVAAGNSGKPVTLLSSARHDARLLAAVTKFETMRGWCRVLFKPTGPARLQHAFTGAFNELCAFERSLPSSGPTIDSIDTAKDPRRTTHISARNGAGQISVIPQPRPVQKTALSPIIESTTG